MTVVLKPIPGYSPYFAGSDGFVYRGGKKLKNRIDDKGYNRVTLSINCTRLTRLTHRLICLAFHGESNLPEVRHINGKRDDSRPHNLAWSDKKTNEADKRAHGTVIEGEKAPWAKLNAEDVDTIRAMARQKVPFKDIAKYYTVGAGTISDIACGKRWKHLPGAIRSCDIRRKMTDEQIQEIRALRGSVSQKKIADMYGVSRNAIYQILAGKSYQHVPFCSNEQKG